MSFLQKTKPANLTTRITAKEHHDRFFSIDAEDVWTADGWLVTSAYITNSGELMSHVRKADKNEIREFSPDEFMFFNITKGKTKRNLADCPLSTPQA
jgi:hypothetical protein